MKKVFSFLFMMLATAGIVSAVPGDNGPSPSPTIITKPGGGIIVIRPEIYGNTPVDIDDQNGSVWVWATPAQPVSIRMIEVESGNTQEYTFISPNVLQFQRQPNLVHITIEYNGAVVIYAYLYSK